MNSYSQTFKNDGFSSHVRTIKSSRINSRPAKIHKMISELNSEIDDLKYLNDTFITTQKIDTTHKLSELIGYNNMSSTESISLPSINDSFDSLDIMISESTSSDKKSLSSTANEINALIKATSELSIIPTKPIESNNNINSQIRRNRRVLRSIDGKLIPY